MVDRGISQRRACTRLGLDCSALRYPARSPAKDTAVIERVKLYAAQYPRVGYRRADNCLGARASSCARTGCSGVSEH